MYFYTQFFRRYDYQRAQCENLEVVRSWLALVENIIAKHGIVSADSYNFDETGFMMGIISTGMVVTSMDERLRAKLVQPGGWE